jgi:type IV pilus assembly protein PilA
VTIKMLTRLRHRAQGQEGFTLIELLVVILIIGILAAVAIPAFLNQKGKANDANVKSDINTAQTAMETYYTDNQSYAIPALSSLTAIEPTLAQAISTTGTEKLTASGTTNTYSISASDPQGITFTLAKATDGTVSRNCTVPANTNPAGCAGATQSSAGSSGTWGN